jgi:hypothetical protein
MTLMLMATLLWGSCLSCAQFFMFPRTASKVCCLPSGKCKPHSKQSPPEECRLQPMAAKDAQSIEKPTATLDSSLPLKLPSSPMGAWLSDAPARQFEQQGSPPDLSLLYSVFRI